MTSSILPEDVLREVASYRTNPLSLCLVSRYFYSFTEEYIFESLDVSPRPTVQQGQSSSINDGELTYQDRLHSILNRLLSRPELGKRVRQLSICSFESSIQSMEDLGSIDDKAVILEDESEARAFSSHFQHEDDAASGLPLLILQGAKNHGMTMGFIRAGRCNAEIILLLHLVPNLKILRIVLPNQDGTTPYPDATAYLRWAAMGAIKGGMPCGLRSVSTIHFPTVYHPQDFDEDALPRAVVSPRTIAELMTLPALREIRAWLDPSEDEVRECGAAIVEFEHTSTVNELFLNVRSVESVTLGPIPRPLLSLPKTLTHLTIRKELYDGTSEPFQFLLDDIFLREWSLEFLDLKIWEFWPRSASLTAISFRSFTRLRYLTITTNILFGNGLDGYEACKRRTWGSQGSPDSSNPRPPASIPSFHELLPEPLEALEIWVTEDWDLELLVSLDIFGGWKHSPKLVNLKKIVMHHQPELSLDGVHVNFVDVGGWFLFKVQKTVLEQTRIAAEALRRQGLELLPFELL